MAGKVKMVDTGDDDKVERGAYKIGSPITPIKPLKKLLVLDLNGLLARTIYRFQNLPFLNQRKPDGIFGSKLVFKRPFCDEFLQFCFSKFEVGLWSTIEKHNVDAVINFVMGGWKHKLLFTWYQSDSSDTGFKTLENDAKPLFLKELKKLWENENGSLPWSKGQFSSSNTLLIDDAPYTALKNPPNTAIFPHPYLVEHIHDDSIGPNGDLRVYLECLSVASNVPAYVEAHPFGQKAITATHPNWNFYSKIITEDPFSSTIRGDVANVPAPWVVGTSLSLVIYEYKDRKLTFRYLLTQVVYI
ncbi:uncharacterized protein LOC131249236 isoform X2 [Magnolia sinica]|uniref:uncharacterized protein LOC131249236 isoform X2 n=2 Tax=Magnolia sinica TaxID=86752 RepID=UPI0026581463|nr:uncharacterized protein LOC131249236 isoform X2 [Magnolia sinica]